IRDKLVTGVQTCALPISAIGVPAHTFVVAFEFPDYHAVSDEWQKINYDNMAKVDRMLALGLIMLADSPQAPKWNQANPKTEPYRSEERRVGKRWRLQRAM